MSSHLQIKFYSKTLSHSIWIGPRLLESPELTKCLKEIKASKFFIITDSVIEPIYGQSLCNFLNSQGLHAALIKFPTGEKYKTRKTKEKLEDQLLQHGAGRDSCLIALGGGVVTDVTGFLASTYCRGIPLIMLPTSLLAMVDASIGGKNGVDVPQGKNLIGTIYQPTAIFMDVSCLQSLPSKELKNGIVEMLKHGLIVDKEYCDFLKTHSKKLLQLDSTTLEEAIYRSCLIKAQIVEEDETEKGKRRLLNLGHTVGHAIETITNHKIPHGRAVAIGIIAEAYLSMQMGYLKQEDFDYIRGILSQFKIDLSWKGKFSPDLLFQIMQMDKKALKNKARFVILNTIGSCLEFNGDYVTEVDEKLLKNVLDWMCKGI